MSLELFVNKLHGLLGEGILDEEINAGLLLRIEINKDGLRFEGIRSEEFCPKGVLSSMQNI